MSEAPDPENVHCPECGDIFNIAEWVNEEASPIWDGTEMTVVCYMCAKGRPTVRP